MKLVDLPLFTPFTFTKRTRDGIGFLVGSSQLLLDRLNMRMVYFCADSVAMGLDVEDADCPVEAVRDYDRRPIIRALFEEEFTNAQLMSSWGVDDR